MFRCEMCLSPATHCCSGLDVPALYFCDRCIVLHEAQCDAVATETAAVVAIGDGRIQA
jgi:hypothetical protein